MPSDLQRPVPCPSQQLRGWVLGLAAFGDILIIMTVGEDFYLRELGVLLPGEREDMSHAHRKTIAI